ncbi:MAG: hypothetical protein M3Z21_02125 [Pseudomonadota bacterium]|nr:hypothetical protein [Pseudomonadota bacterium]
MTRYLNAKIGDALAAEYVLGTLKGRARQRFEGLAGAHPSLRHRVREWESRLNRLAGFTPPVPPPRRLWAGIEARLFPAAPVTPWWQRLVLWRGLALGSSVAAGVLAVLLVIAPVNSRDGYVALVQDTAQKPVWLISTSADMERFYVKNLKPMTMPKNIRCLLWVKPQDSQQAYALGPLPDDGGDMMLTVDDDVRPMLHGRLMVTVEDVSAATPPQPGGPAVYQGEWLPVKRI